MNDCAKAVMKSFSEIEIAYGTSDEFSFVLDRHSQLFQRRASKLQSTFVSLFSSNYVFLWNETFPDKKLLYPPCFDARTVCYPNLKTIRDYLSWRQADCHINNLYNTCFWNFVLKGNKTQAEAEEFLRGTVSSDFFQRSTSITMMNHKFFAKDQF